jgi:hypothetical protein
MYLGLGGKFIDFCHQVRKALRIYTNFQKLIL